MITASERNSNKTRIMTENIALRAVDIFLSILKQNGKSDAYINFGGGEPLLNRSVIESVLNYCHTKYGKKFKFNFRINTNASLVTPEVAGLLKTYDVKPAISLDGLESANDKVRKTKSGNGTFNKIINGINNLEKVNYAAQGFSTTVTEENFDLIDDSLIDFAEKRDLGDIRIDLDVIHLLSIPIESVIQKIMNLKTLAESKGMHLAGFWERPAENLNNSILEKHIAFCGGIAGKSMCVSPSEEIFICGYSGKKFSSLSQEEILSSKTYDCIVTGRLAGRIKRCKDCPIEGQCIGGCFITEEFNDLDKKAALSYNCELYQRMTAELLKKSLKEAISNLAETGTERRKP